MEYKTCKDCNEEKNIEEFYVLNKEKGYRNSYCKVCSSERKKKYTNKEKQKKYISKWRSKNKDKNNEYQRNWYSKNKEKAAARSLKWQEDNPEMAMINRAKLRARKKEIPFDLTLEDVSIPEECPLLGITLEKGRGKLQDNSPSLDRIVPELGYVAGNVIVISHKANRIKNNASLEELLLLGNNLKNLLKNNNKL
jgi:hypothetical protein